MFETGSTVPLQVVEPSPACPITSTRASSTQMGLSGVGLNVGLDVGSDVGAVGSPSPPRQGSELHGTSNTYFATFLSFGVQLEQTPGSPGLEFSPSEKEASLLDTNKVNIAYSSPSAHCTVVSNVVP